MFSKVLGKGLNFPLDKLVHHRVLSASSKIEGVSQCGLENEQSRQCSADVETPEVVPLQLNDNVDCLSPANVVEVLLSNLECCRMDKAQDGGGFG